MSSDSDRSERFDADADSETNRSVSDEQSDGSSNERQRADEPIASEASNDGETTAESGPDGGAERIGETDSGVRVEDAEGSADLLSRWTGGDTGPDRSVLNRAAIRRFTEGVLTAYGGAVNRETNGRWSVTLPEALATELGTGTERARVVFDGTDREVGSEDIVVAPGTRAFRALCALARDSVLTSDTGSSSAAKSPPAGESVAETEPEASAGTETASAGWVGVVHLGSDVLQLHCPPVLNAAGFETGIEEFSSRGTERALAFHFRAQFLSVHSYQRTEHVTIAVDPATRSHLPTLAARLTSHLPRLFDPRGERNGGREASERKNGTPDSSDSEFDRETVRGAYSTAKSAAIEAVRPTAEDLRAEEEVAIADRIAEISEYYDRRRAELEERLDAKRATIEELSAKYDRAQGDETRLRYLGEQREAEDELASFTDKVENRKTELDDEERARIEEETERHRVDVDLELAHVTRLTYDRGTLSLSVTDGEVTAHPTVSYIPATDEFHRLDCACCGTDLTADRTTSDPDSNSNSDSSSAISSSPDRPRLCVGGHLACSSCVTTCRTCGEGRCASCLDAARTAGDAGAGTELESGPEIGPESESGAGAEPETATETEIDPFETCTLCRESVCADCLVSCAICGERICGDHRETCDACDAVTCLACGEPCEFCGTFHCDDHLLAPPGPATEASGTKRFCEAHVAACTECGERRGIDAIEFCGACDEPLCERHDSRCSVCGEVRCSAHAIPCRHCADAGGDPEAITAFCSEHAERCAGGDEVICEAHSRPGVIVDGWVCSDHRRACELCGVEYAERGFTEGRCPACVGFDAETPAEPPVAAIAEEFSTTRIGVTPTHAVIQGKKRLRRDEIVVVDRNTGEEVRRFKADFFSKLSGGP